MLEADHVIPVSKPAVEPSREEDGEVQPNLFEVWTSEEVSDSDHLT